MVSPTDAAVRAFLRSSMIAQVATRSARGHPFLTPLWFVEDRRVLYLTTAPETRAGRNVTQNPQVTLLLRGEHRGFDQVLRLHGLATCHRGLPSWPVLLRAAAKYYISPRALSVELRNMQKWPLRRLYYGQLKGGFGYIRVVPTTAEFLPSAAGSVPELRMKS